MSGPVHTRDEDCTLDEDGTCTGCGVSHADEGCAICGGRGFHRVGCDLGDHDSPAEQAAAARVGRLRLLAEELRRKPTTGATWT